MDVGLLETCCSPGSDSMARSHPTRKQKIGTYLRSHWSYEKMIKYCTDFVFFAAAEGIKFRLPFLRCLFQPWEVLYLSDKGLLIALGV